MTISNSNLFKPINIGKKTISHRIAHLPTTRNRATKDHVPTDLMQKYYTDRAKTGGLLVTEATLISLNQGIYPNVPGIWNNRQRDAWKKITDSVHSVGGFISVQLWALGRVGNAKLLKNHGLPLTGVSPIYEHEQAEKDAVKAENPIQELTQDEIKDIIYNQFANAAKLADEAGFDFIELHGANVVDHLSTIVDPSKLAIRLSPLNNFQVPGINPTAKEDYSYIIAGLQKRADEGKGFGYINVVEGRFSPDGSTEACDVNFVGDIWKGALLKGGNYTYDKKNSWETMNVMLMSITEL
ncbi:NADH:flavin oxidoreductase / NADH oxidase family protein [Candida albicans]|uniref:NADH:flavin oxidoreductase / NADH oxidase family protein n=1 Tax=Candida albicans TaxID=5476 RepID=A0A8H6F5A7_CANAX|nr:NADH:flavin oxidoreductase / NADH oxidase family protein [Candida albicans]